MSKARYLTYAPIALSSLLLMATAGCGTNAVSGGTPGPSLPDASSVMQPAGTSALQSSSIRSLGSAASPAYVSTIQHDKPAAFYQLNDLNATMADSSGNAINGSYGTNVTKGAPPITNTGAMTPTFAGGTYDPTMFAAAPISPLLQPQAVTVEAWIKPSAVNTTGTFVPIVAYGKQSQGPSYSITVNPQNSLRFWARTDSGSVSAGSSTALVPGQAYFVAATYDGAVVNLYINGRLEYSNPGTGNLYYKQLNAHDGLGIGGSLDKGAPQFAGNISEVAVYGSALPQSELAAHFVAGNITPLLTERAQTTDKFIASIGVNTHLHYTGTVYDTQFATIKSLLVNLGVRHIRDGLLDTKWQPYYDRLNDLGRSGIRATLTTSLGQTPALLTSYPARLPNSFEAYEAPNELDIYDAKDPNWVANARSFTQMLYTTVKNNPQTAGFRVIGPSFTSNQAQVAVGDLSQYMDDGNVHQYFASYNPGTDGWGAHTSYGIVGSIPWNMNVERIVAGSRPLIATETGYNTGVSANYVPESIQAKYMPRTLFEMFNHGVVRSMIYELLDWDPSNHENKYGLVSPNLQPKPAYNALKNLIGVLRDPSPAFQTSLLAYTIGGDVADVHHTLMQKGDGSYYLALWQEARSFVPGSSPGAAGTFRPAAPQSITVTMPTAPGSATLETLDDNGNLTSTPATILGNTITVNVKDDVSLLKIAP